LTTNEESYRFSIFVTNKLKIEAHNSNTHRTYSKELNRFSDVTDDEFVSTYLTAVISTIDYLQAVQKSPINPHTNATSIDWVALGRVTSVKDQGKCGSCWAFSAAAAFESGLLIKYGFTTDLSEQELIDCSISYGNKGCNGGWMVKAFKYIGDHGLSTEETYPFKAVKQACKPQSGPVFRITGYNSTTGCANLTSMIFNRPYSVAVDATNWAHYKTGIFNNCTNKSNHGVLLVGYNLDTYWKIKNSWGADWG
jgi:C1A family cysteine protease